MHFARHVAAVKGSNIFAHVKRSADVEIVALQGPDRPVGGLPHRVGGSALLVVYVLHRVRVAMRDAEEGDVCPKCIEICLHWHVEKALMSVFRGNGEWQGHWH